MSSSNSSSGQRDGSIGRPPEGSSRTGLQRPARPRPMLNMSENGTGMGLNFGSKRSTAIHLNLTPSPGGNSPVSRGGMSEAEKERKLREIMSQTNQLQINGRATKTNIDELELLGDLGNGTCGHVVKMRHVPSCTVIAVKQMRRTGNPDEENRILMDLDVVLKSHDCKEIVLCLGCFITNSDVWICMELMATCFDKLLKQLKQPIPEAICGKVAVATLKALNYLKEKHDVIHRDVKPSNILLDAKGRVKLCDFGISGRLVESQAKTRNAGCAAYMAPERIEPPQHGKTGYHYDIRSDVWSLGITLVEMATGTFPYKDCKSDFEVSAKVVQEDPPLLPMHTGFSQEFCCFVRDCLMKNYKDRPKYRKLLQHSFILKYEQEEVDVGSWYRSTQRQLNLKSAAAAGTEAVVGSKSQGNESGSRGEVFKPQPSPRVLRAGSKSNNGGKVEKQYSSPTIYPSAIGEQQRRRERELQQLKKELREQQQQLGPPPPPYDQYSMSTNANETSLSKLRIGNSSGDSSMMSSTYLRPRPTTNEAPRTTGSGSKAYYERWNPSNSHHAAATAASAYSSPRLAGSTRTTSERNDAFGASFHPTNPNYSGPPSLTQEEKELPRRQNSSASTIPSRHTHYMPPTSAAANLDFTFKTSYVPAGGGGGGRSGPTSGCYESRDDATGGGYHSLDSMLSGTPPHHKMAPPPSSSSSSGAPYHSHHAAPSPSSRHRSVSTDHRPGYTDRDLHRHQLPPHRHHHAAGGFGSRETGSSRKSRSDCYRVAPSAAAVTTTDANNQQEQQSRALSHRHPKQRSPSAERGRLTATLSTAGATAPTVPQSTWKAALQSWGSSWSSSISSLKRRTASSDRGGGGGSFVGSHYAPEATSVSVANAATPPSPTRLAPNLSSGAFDRRFQPRFRSWNEKDGGYASSTYMKR